MPHRSIILFGLIAFIWTVPESASLPVLELWVRNSAPLILLSLAAGLIISAGQIDIASGAISSFAGMIIVGWFYYLPESQWSLVGAIAAATIGIAALYLLMASGIVLLGIPALLCTLGILFVAKGLAVALQALVKGNPIFMAWGVATRGEGRLTVPVEGAGELFRVGWVWVVVIVLAFIGWRFLTESGLRHIAVGIDPQAARIAGIRPERIYFKAFAVGGAVVTLSTMIALFDIQIGGWSADTGWGKELLAIAAAVIGGCRITGGRFDPLSISLAAVLVTAVQDAIDGSLLPTELSYLFLGCALLLAAIIDSIGNRPYRWLART